jgi:hypothetical protein
MDELQKLLKELEELTKEPEPKAQPQAPAQAPQPTQAPQDNANVSGVEEQFRAWKELGLIRFGSQYGHLKNFSKILNLVIPKADQRVLSDIQAGKVEDEYFDYLERAYNETIKEIASFSKDLLSSQFQTSRQKTASAQPQAPSYTMEDFNNEYKKYLEKTTAKEVAQVEFLDGIVDENGKRRRTGIPKASIYETTPLET